MSKKLRPKLVIRDLLNRARSIDRTVEGEVFLRVFESSPLSLQQEAIELIKDLDTEGLKRWIQDREYLDLSDRTTVWLRDKAAKIGIKNYSRMSRVELIREITHEETRNGRPDSRVV